MNVAVLGLWHLGSVTAACTASVGHTVQGWDPDPQVVAHLNQGRPPVKEPGLAELVAAQLRAGRLAFTPDLAAAVACADVVWVAFDTPVDQEDRADVDEVVRQVARAFPYLKPAAVVLLSSQLPVGTARRLEEMFRLAQPGRTVSFACTPENLRLGQAIEGFTQPDRVVVGVRTAEDRARLEALFAPISDRLEWMSVESAEMTKHAINAFLATSVAFINEIAVLSERAGADAREVERGLKTERRIGPHAYLTPGSAFAGGTLARDLTFLRALGAATACPTAIIDGVQASNLDHRAWPRRRLAVELGHLSGRRVAVWGLTYKAGTDTLRRSEAVELCRWLVGEQAIVTAHDPVASELPGALQLGVTRTDDPVVAARGADVLVVATEWPIYRHVDLDALAEAMPRGVVIDANRFLGPTFGTDRRFRLISVGHSGNGRPR